MKIQKLKQTKNIIITNLHSANLMGDDAGFKKIYEKYQIDCFESQICIDGLSIADSILLFGTPATLEFFLKNNSNESSFSDYSFRKGYAIYASILDDLEKYKILKQYKLFDNDNLLDIVASNIAPISLEKLYITNKTEIKPRLVTKHWVSALNSRISYVNNIALETLEQLEHKFINSVVLICNNPDDIFKIKISLIYGLILGEMYEASTNINQHKIYNLLIKTGFLDPRNNVLDELERTIHNLSLTALEKEKEYFNKYKVELSNNYKHYFNINRTIANKSDFHYEEAQLLEFERSFLNLSIKNTNKNNAIFKV